MVSKTQTVVRLCLPLAFFLCSAAETCLHAEDTPLEKQAKHSAAVALFGVATLSLVFGGVAGGQPLTVETFTGTTVADPVGNKT